MERSTVAYINNVYANGSHKYCKRSYTDIWRLDFDTKFQVSSHIVREGISPRVAKLLQIIKIYTRASFPQNVLLLEKKIFTRISIRQYLTNTAMCTIGKNSKYILIPYF